MEPRDYHLWKQMQKQMKQDLLKQGDLEGANAINIEEELIMFSEFHFFLILYRVFF
jgi:hypothetical protein